MDMSDDVLGLVLERVGSHVSLVRAAAVCRRWCRAIADAAFLRRFRSLHAPAVAGVYHNRSRWADSLMGVDARKSKGPVFLPSSPSMVNARHFSLDFLPDDTRSWKILDSRGSLLLIMGIRGCGHAFSGMVVCEPLTRCCKVISSPADFNGFDFLCSCLVDGYANVAGGRIGMSNFRVLFMFKRDGVTLAAMFTVASSWSEKHIVHIAPSLRCPYLLGRSGGSRYFYIGDRMVMELDGSTGDSTSFVLPAIQDWDYHIANYNCFVTEGRDGKPRIFTMLGNYIKVLASLDSGEWALEMRVLLSEATHGLPGDQPSFFSYDQGILTRGVGFVNLSPKFGERWPCSIDPKTMKAKLMAGDMGPMVHPYELPWPPALHACLDS